MICIDMLLDLLFPRKCAFCRRLTQNGAVICPRCREKLHYTNYAARQDFPHLDGCYSPLYYTDEVRQSLLRYKFGGLRMYASVYGEFLAKCIDENRISCDSISWVPLSAPIGRGSFRAALGPVPPHASEDPQQSQAVCNGKRREAAPQCKGRICSYAGSRPRRENDPAGR